MMSHWVSRPAVLAGVLAFIPFLFNASGCGSGEAEPESRGMLIQIRGELRVLETESEQARYCVDSFCEPNYIYYAHFGRTRPKPAPSQPAQPPQPPQPNEQLDYSRRILKLPDAWRVTQGSSEIIVAVVDTGVAVDHPDLAANIWVNRREASGARGVDDDGNGFVDDVYGYDFANSRANGLDDHMHGTHCAGIIGAQANGIGIVGVSPRVKIMPLKFLKSDGSGDTEAAIRAIDYAVNNGAQVISNSWGGVGRSQLLEAAISRAVSRGVLVVAAAGNEANNNDQRPTYPASFPGVIAVASTDEQDQISSFSNYGQSSVFIAAPGSRILSTVPGGKYATLSGTSMAAPQVAGALALGLSLTGGQTSASGAERLLQAMCLSAAAVHRDKTECGRLDAFEFVRRLVGG